VELCEQTPDSNQVHSVRSRTSSAHDLPLGKEIVQLVG
jgi:hypothetical protein